jgi:phosphoribosylglycinamide formyltransferase-1
VLISGTGSLLQAMITASQATSANFEVVAVGADREAAGLDWAKQAGIAHFVLPLLPGADRGQWDQRLADQVAAFNPDLIVSAGFMKLLGPAFLQRFPNRVINSHPSLLPSFPGQQAVREAINWPVKVTGCTVFLVDAGVDSGPILAQVPVLIEPDDDEASLHERIKSVERQLLVGIIADWPRGR